MNEIKLKPIGYVRNSRTEPVDDDWSPVESTIELVEELPEYCLDGIEQFSHLEIIYYFDRVDSKDIVLSGRPRGNPAYPQMGIFAQRKKDRPNTLGLAIVELLEHKGRSIKVRYLDAIDGTPILDIKPVFKEYLPKSEIRQPGWVSDLMSKYW